MTSRNIINFALLLALAGMWAGSFLFIRVTVDAIGPVTLSFLRTSIASLMLLAIVYMRGEKLHLVGNVFQYSILGLLNAALPFVLIGFAELKLEAAIAATLNACTPLFALILAALYKQEKITPGKITALFLGAFGVFFATSRGIFGMQSFHLIEILASLAAAFCYASAAIYAKRSTSNIHPIALACGQQIAASIILLPFMLLTVHSVTLNSTIVLSVFLLGTLSTGVAYLIYFYLITRIGATLTSTVTLVIPVFGMIFGYILLGEMVTTSKIIGLVLILASVSYLMYLRSIESRQSSKTYDASELRHSA